MPPASPIPESLLQNFLKIYKLPWGPFVDPNHHYINIHIITPIQPTENVGIQWVVILINTLSL